MLAGSVAWWVPSSEGLDHLKVECSDAAAASAMAGARAVEAWLSQSRPEVTGCLAEEQLAVTETDELEAHGTKNH